MPASSPSTTSHSTPTLPTEMIEEILKVEVLSKQDLARCCLVSKQFLPTSRKRLYDQLALLYGPLERERHQTATATLYPTKSTTLLLDTLRQHSFLRSLPSSVGFIRLEFGKFVEGAGAIDVNPIETALQLVPKVKHLQLDRHFSVPQHIAPCFLDSKTKIVCLEVCNLQLKTLPLLQNLRKLRIRAPFDIKIDTGSGSAEPLLPGLEVLNISHLNRFPPPHFISQQLKALQISLKPDYFLELSLLPHLERLWLELVSYREELVHDLNLASLTKLKALYLSDIALCDTTPSSSLDDAVFFDKLIEFPPPRKICITFPSLVPWTSLIRHLESPAPFLANELCLSDLCLNDPRTRSSLALLRLNCETKGISLSFASRDSMQSTFSECDHLLH